MKFGLFSDLGLTVKFRPSVDNLVFRLHYRITYMIIMGCVILTTLYDVVGDKIKCMTNSKIPKFGALVNSYCLIMGTFTVDKHHNTSISPIGVEGVPHPGVGPFKENEDDITIHSYYQWVPFFLFSMAVLFYLPHWLWKIMEGGLFTNVIQDLSLKDYLSKNMNSYNNRKDRFNKLAKYLSSHMHQHRSWAIKFFLCEVLNLIVTISVMEIIDWFLGGEFLSYGAKVMEISGQDPENRIDPMSFVFPRIAKCSFRMFGPSGNIETRDIMCLIATNIINEKIFLFLWVWLIVLFCITILWLLFRFATILSSSLRLQLLKLRAPQAENGEIEKVMQHLSLSDWLLLCHLGKNMDTVVFSEFISEFSEILNSNKRNSDLKPLLDQSMELSNLKI